MKRKIYLLKRIKETDYDQIRGAVVIADSESLARELLHTEICHFTDYSGDEQARTWKLSKLSCCIKLGYSYNSQPAGIILVDYKAG